MYTDRLIAFTRYSSVVLLVLVMSSCAKCTNAAEPLPRNVRAQATSSNQGATRQPLTTSGKFVNPEAKGNKFSSTVEHASSSSESHDAEYFPVNHSNSYIGQPVCGCNRDCHGCRIGDIGDCCRRGTMESGYWMRAEYLLWSLDGIELPPLVATSGTGTLPVNTGVIGQAGTTVLFGGERVLDSMRSGLRLTLGWAHDSCGNGFEVSGMHIFNDDKLYTSTESLVARPVFDTFTASESSMLVAHPSFLSGIVKVHVGNELSSIDINRRLRLSSCRCQTIDFLYGYRYGNLDEMLRVDQSSLYTAAQGQIIAGTSVDLFDQFKAVNHFHGAQLGLHIQQTAGPTNLSLMAKLGLGVNNMETTINGQTTNMVPGGGSATFPGGLLAQTTNIGTYDESKFIVLPEIGLNITTLVDRNLRLTIGYNLMAWSNAARVADAVDRSVSQFPPEPPSGTRNPAYESSTSSFFAQGLNVGAVFSF